ncbi:MAG: FecR domain-containing protein [Deltaproteobacteria bacterium]|nr:FecR domain-containing protein [Deltaproteobacteria bacterium]MBI3391120.1 FecR domain-containing protein [Deltaproteobacteria bacterium]
MRRVRLLATFTLLIAIALPAAATEIGTVAAMEGSAEIGRDEEWTPATVGAPIQEKDELRTGRPGHLKVVFQDDSVIILSDDSHLTVDRQVFNSKEGEADSAFGLLQGKVHALVNSYYGRLGTRFEVKSSTAVAGVRGTEFLMTYDPETDLTEVIGITGAVSVHSAADPTGPGVLITASEATNVPAGGLPSEPEKLDDKTFKRYLQGTDFISIGAAGLSTGHQIVAGAGVPQPDRGPVLAAGPEPIGLANNGAGGIAQGPNASDLLGQPPASVKAMTGSLGINVGNPH